ncbi:plexin-A4-like [Ptychodera flava]|uniref:plexin-A4-like n=1 Tax=Ptychodera flava TaxID=63121 RepID=UPI00396A4B09
MLVISIIDTNRAEEMSLGRAEGSSNRCPQIVAGDEILIPVDVDKEYQVKVKNLPTAMSDQSGYQCVLIIEGVEIVVEGQRVDQHTVNCQSLRYAYSEKVSNKLVPLKLRWNNGFYVDNPDQVQVNLYKCGVEGSNCGVCHQRNLKYKCGWCESGNEAQKCTVVGTCSQVTHWLTRDKICPDPTITGCGTPMSDALLLVLECVHYTRTYRARERHVLALVQHGSLETVL